MFSVSLYATCLALTALAAHPALAEVNATPSNPARLRAAPASIVVKAQRTRQDITDLGTSIAKVEDAADQLDVAIGTQRRKLIEAGRIDQRLTVDVMGSGTDSIANITVTIDTFPIYTFDQTAAMAHSAERLVIYDGPINSGQHTVQVNGRLVKTMAGVSDLNATYRDFSETYVVSLPAEAFRKRIKIVLNPDADAAKAVALFSQYDLEQEEKL